jgi:carboxypeptidase T
MAGRPRRPHLSVPHRLAASALLAVVGLAATVGPALAANFPPKDSRYHNYAEMVSEIHAVEAAHPSIVRLFSIGESYQGRTLWAAKISDNIDTDEREPEVLFDALHHAREHLTVEQGLYLLHLLADNYNSDATVKRLVDTRVIWIVFMLNPDGAEYDLTCGGEHAPYCAWRKNRQPNGAGQPIGTDLNRNYDYRWACCGGSSGNRASETYRGPYAFSAPESRALRDFVNARVKSGVQRIKAHITFHTNGQLILWPYGHTRTDIPSDMTVADHSVFVAMGKAMAARNGYKPEQSSDLYITDGDQIDWMYGRHRIFSYTWELYPPETATVWGDHYPADENIAPQTARNRSALLYFIDMAGCPYAAIGAQQAMCGAFMDDFEIGRGWTINPYGNDAADRGAWARGDPEPTFTGGVLIQPPHPHSGSNAFTTGLAAGSTASANDLDGGATTIRSQPILLPSTVGSLTFRWYFAHDAKSSRADSFLVFVESGGTRTRVFREYGGPSLDEASWQKGGVPLARWAGQSVRIVFQATDGGPDNLVEAGVDDVYIERP